MWYCVRGCDCRIQRDEENSTDIYEFIVLPLNYNIFLYHLRFWDRVKGYLTSSIALNRDLNRYWVATLFSQFSHIVRCTCIRSCVKLQIYLCFHACTINSYILPKSMLQLLQKQYPSLRFTILYISIALSYKGWHIFIECVGLLLIFYSPAIGYLQENEGWSRKIWNLVQVQYVGLPDK